MRKTKKMLAMLMTAALFAGPCASGQFMYEVYAEDAGNEDVISAQETSEQGDLAKSRELQGEDGSQEQINEVQEEVQETQRETQEQIRKVQVKAQEAAQGREEYTEEEAFVMTEKAVESGAVSEEGDSGTNHESAITVERVSVKSGASVSALETPAQFNVEVQIKAPVDMGIRTVELGYYCMEKNKELRFLKEYDTEDMWYPGAEGGNCEILVELNEYIATGKYELQYISVDGENNSIIYNYDGENKVFIEGDMEDEMSHRFSYDGDADYTVAKSVKEDNSRPEVTSLKRVTSEDIYSNTPVQYEVGYIEEGSGIKKIELNFFKTGEDASDGGVVDAYIYEGKPTDIGTGKIDICAEYREPGEYYLNGFGIEDYAGNRRYYSLNAAGTAYVDMLNDDGERKSVEVSEVDRSYEVKFKPYGGVMLKGVKAVLPDGMDKDRLAAGDVFEVVATVVNSSTSEKQVIPENCMISWYKPDNHLWDYVVGSGQSYMLAPEAEGEVCFKIQVSPFAVTGKRELSSINIGTITSDYEGLSYDYLPDAGKLTASIMNPEGVNEIVGYLEYNQEIDYVVTISEKPDEEAPYLDEISVNTKNIKAPGKVSFDIQMPDEGYAKVEEIHFQFTERENAKNVLFFDTVYNGKLEYSSEKKCYVYEVELGPSITKGVYELIWADIIDEAGNSRHYEKSEKGTLVDTDNPGNVLKPCEMTVIEAESEDYDFDVPVLKNVVLTDKDVKNGGEIQLRIDAEDASDLGLVTVIYRDIKSDTAMELSCWDIKKSEGGYLCNFTVDKYCESGEYRLSSIWLTDGSERWNGILYDYNPDTLTLYPQYEDRENVVLKENLDIKVAEPEDMVITNINKENVSEVADTVEQGGIIVVKGADIEESGNGAIPKEFLEKAKEKELTVIIPDKNSSSEIVVDGKTLGDVPAEDIELKVQRGELNEEEITVGTTKDNIYYPIDVVVSDTKLPFTLRIRLDSEFLEQCGNRPIRFSKVAADGNSVVLQDNVKVDEEGYLEVTFKDGIGDSVSSQMLYAGRNGENVPVESSNGTRYIVSSQIAEIEAGSGDINADGKVDILDLMLCLNHVSRKSELTGDRFRIADVDGNGKVDLLDLMRILNYVSKKTDTV